MGRVMAGRFAVAVALAGTITFALFFLMQHLIATADVRIQEGPQGRVIDFVRVKHKTQIQEKSRDMPELQQNLDQPPPPSMSMPDTAAGSGAKLAVKATAPVDIKKLDSPKLGPAIADAGCVPKFRMRPMYPARAQQMEIEGWARVRFDVNPEGQVVNAQVLAAEPPRVFDKNAIRTIKKWRYNPKVSGGKPAWCRGQVVKLRFEMPK